MKDSEQLHRHRPRARGPKLGDHSGLQSVQRGADHRGRRLRSGDRRRSGGPGTRDVRVGRVAQAARRAPRRGALPRRRDHQVTHRGTRRARVPGQRHDRHGRAADHQGVGRHAPLLRRLGRQDPRRVGQPGVRRSPRPLRDLPHVHPARAGRRRRPDHSLERAVLRRDAQGRARAGRRLQRGPQARRGDPAHRAEARGDLPRGGPARRRVERHHRLRRDHGCGPDRAPRRRQDLVHRIDRGRSPHRQGGRGQSQAADARARRQVTADHVRRRQSRQGDHGRRHGPVGRVGAELLVHLAHLRPARDLRPGRRGPGRLRPDAADGRQRGSRIPFSDR